MMAADETGGAASTGADDAAGLSGRTILLVEDEALIAMDLEMTLEDAGAEVVGPVTSLEDAVAQAGTGAFDAAILDIDLRGEDVFPAAEALQGRGVPFVFHSGHGARAELLARFPDAGLIEKPASPEAVVAALTDVLKPRP